MTNDTRTEVRGAMIAEFGPRLTTRQIDAVVSQVLDDLRGAITEFSMVAAARDLCRQRLLEQVAPPHRDDGG